MLNPRAIAIPIAAAVLFVGGCHSRVYCTAELRASLVITVVGKDGQPVCRTTVTVRDDDFSKVLGENRSTQPCNHSGVYERRGTYSITASKGALHTTVDGVKVSADRCHVHTRHVTIVLGS